MNVIVDPEALRVADEGAAMLAVYYPCKPC